MIVVREENRRMGNCVCCAHEAMDDPLASDRDWLCFHSLACFRFEAPNRTGSVLQIWS